MDNTNKDNIEKKISLFHYKGLPIALLALGFMVVFVLVAFYATQQTQVTDTSAKGRRVNRVKNVKKAKVVTKPVVVDDASGLDSLLLETDSLSNKGLDIKESDLSDLEE